MTPPVLIRHVLMTYPGAVQTIAALEARIAYLQEHGDAWAIVDCHGQLALVREAFGLRPSEAQLDAAHEASVAEFRELADAELPDVPVAAFDPAEGSPDPVPDALLSYWNRGA